MNANTTSGDWAGRRQYATVKLPKPVVHVTHPFRHPDNHNKLLEYLQQRLWYGAKARDSELGRLVQVDRKVAGWIRRSQADKDRKRENERNGTPVISKLTLPLEFIHLDDMMTYFAQTFAPNRGMFYHTGRPGETNEAAQIVTKMNNDAIYSGYFSEVLKGIFGTLKYNCSGFWVEWGQESGPEIVATQGGTKVDNVIKWRGNRLEAIDRYNFLYDATVHPSKLYCEGEFAASVKLRSHFWLQNKASLGAYFNCEEALQQGADQGTAASMRYYKYAPAQTNIEWADGVDHGQPDWLAILSEQEGSMMDGYEVTRIYIRLNPTEFGLIEGNTQQRALRDRFEIWSFTVLNDKWIIEAQYQNNIHNHIPAYLALIHDDSMGKAQKSPGELIEPLQDFASGLLNIHIEATRSSLWGITAYDPRIIDFKKVPKGEVAAFLPVEPGGYGKKLADHIWQHNSTLETKQTMSDLSAVMDIINQFFPTQALPSQIASIDRAVTDQVAAVQQGANRRQQKVARLLDDSMFSRIRYAMYYNIIQFQPDEEEITDYYTGQPVKLELSKLRQTNLPFIIGQGLKAIDRSSTAQMLQQVIFALIQAPQAQQNPDGSRIDMLKLIDYWTSMIDIDINMEQFRIAAPPPQTAPGAGVEGEPTGGINPATAPANLTEPIYS